MPPDSPPDSDNPSAPDKRRFSRVRFRSSALLVRGNGGYQVPVLDLSLKGALLGKPPDWPHPEGTAVTLELWLDEGDRVIRLDGHVAHIGGERLGIACTSIDLDSITHLRRLIELNLGDPAQALRELGAMLR